MVGGCNRYSDTKSNSADRKGLNCGVNSDWRRQSGAEALTCSFRKDGEERSKGAGRFRKGNARRGRDLGGAFRAEEEP